jgi:hypothetical protein
LIEVCEFGQSPLQKVVIQPERLIIECMINILSSIQSGINPLVSEKKPEGFPLGRYPFDNFSQ